MEVTKQNRLKIRTHNVIFIGLFLTCMGLLFWLSNQYDQKFDWTATNRHTLSEASVKVLSSIPEAISVTAFVTANSALTGREEIEVMIGRYQKHKADIELTFIDPNTQPDLVREKNISVDGELIITYQGRSEHVTTLREEEITNALQRLLRSSERHIVFLGGHGERNPKGQANHDYGLFSQHLASKGIITSQLNLNEQPEIPEDTAVLVIAGPQLDYLPGELDIIHQYVKQGGNLLWLHDPGKLYHLDALAKDLNIKFVPGIIVDPTTQLLGIEDPSIALITRYGNHPITLDFNYMSLFPRAVAVDVLDPAESTWQNEPFLLTVERSWSETGKLEGEIEFADGIDVPGPLALGVALQRDKPGEFSTTRGEDTTAQQRVIVVGDGDFISNSTLGNQGNQDLGYNILNWLSHDDNFISIPISTSPDSNIQLSETSWIIIAAIFIVFLPALLLVAGIVIWLKRRNR